MAQRSPLPRFCSYNPTPPNPLKIKIRSRCILSFLLISRTIQYHHCPDSPSSPNQKTTRIFYSCGCTHAWYTWVPWASILCRVFKQVLAREWNFFWTAFPDGLYQVQGHCLKGQPSDQQSKGQRKNTDLLEQCCLNKLQPRKICHVVWKYISSLWCNRLGLIRDRRRQPKWW